MTDCFILPTSREGILMNYLSNYNAESTHVPATGAGAFLRLYDEGISKVLMRSRNSGSAQSESRKEAEVLLKSGVRLTKIE